MKKRKAFIFCRNKKLNKKPYSIKVWVEELSSWIVFDNFATQEMAQTFLEVERGDIEKYIIREIKKNGGKKETKKRSVSDTTDAKQIA